MRSRKRRGPGQHSTQQFQPAPTVSTTRQEADEEGVALAAPMGGGASAVAAAPAAPTSRRRRSQQVDERSGTPAERFLGGELRHIGMVALVIVALLAAATIALGGGL